MTKPTIITLFFDSLIRLAGGVILLFVAGGSPLATTYLS
jgi:hypothetical protein